MPDALKIHTGRYVFSICLMCLLCGPSLVFAQQQPVRSDTSDTASTSQPVLNPANPGLQEGPSDTSQVGEPANRPTDVPDAVKFQSSDSLVVDFREGRTASLYGSAKIEHESGTLTSGKVDMDLETDNVEALAETPEDTLSMPVLTRDGEEIRSNRILFNYRTNKGKFEAARVKVGEGYLIGSQVKNVSETEVFIEDGIYSTCPPDYLYYYIKAKKMKVVDQDEIFFQNARLYILDIPYPMIFPFGYVPSGIEEKQSGLLTPTYVFEEQDSRGIGLTNFGWFQYINDYLTTQASLDIYTSGTFNLESFTQYRNTDNYSGSLNLGYSRVQGLEPTDPGFSSTTNKLVAVQHSQTLSPYASLNANINIRTADYYRQTSLDDYLEAETSSESRLAYRYSHPENIFSFNTSAGLSQNFTTEETTLQGPTANFNVRTFSPFQNADGNPNETKWYENLTLSYDNTFQSRFTYQPVNPDSTDISFLDALFDPDLYREASDDNDYIRYGFRQSASSGLSSIIPSRFINSSASITYNEYWYPSSIRQSYNADSNRVETEKVVGFVTARDFSTNFSVSTTIYGVSTAKIGKLKGFRHTLKPSIGLTYQPDFSDESWGFYRTVQTDTLGNTRRYSIFQNEILGGPGSGEQRRVNFRLSNILETKVVRRDTAGEVNEENFRLIDNLSLGTAYNFAADSLNWTTLSADFSSNAIDGVKLSAQSSFSFYQRNDSTGQFINRFLTEEGRLAQMLNLRVSASTDLRFGREGVKAITPAYRRVYDPFIQNIFSPIDAGFGYEPVRPLNTPFSFRLDFSYTWQYRHNQRPDITAELNAKNINFNLTPKWSFSTQIGYDFVGKELTPAKFTLRRNLECWDLFFQINPFGDQQYYLFRLSVNNQQIQSLFQKLPILNNLERRSGGSGLGNPTY